MAQVWDGSVGIDATPIRTFAKGRRTSGPTLATDPDAGWYVRDGDHRDPDSVAEHIQQAKTESARRNNRRKVSLRNKYLYGYDAHLVVARDASRDNALLEDGSPNPEVLPTLVLGVALDKPGERPDVNGLRILTRLRSRGYEPGYLAGDRAYNNSKPDQWQLPIRALGYKPVYDYRVDDLGKQAETHGARLIEGTWYCPSMPQPLVDATKDLHAGHIDRETWVARIAARRAYRLVPKQNQDADGHQRHMCPAEAGKVQCPLKKHSMGRDPRLPLIDPEPTPTGPYKVCRQRSVTVAPEEGAKHWQPLAYGDEEWQKIYFRLRNSVEGWNGYTKNPLAESIEQAGRRRIRGIAAQTVLLVFQLAHANERKINKWLNTLALGGKRALRRTHQRRKTKSLRSWTPTGHLTPIG